jgi:hypothetical protein
MQDLSTPSPKSSLLSSSGPSAPMPDATPPVTEETSSAPSSSQEESLANSLEQSMTALKETLGEHKGKLAIGAAATLGLMVFYKWREKQLAEEEPQEYERLQRIKNRVRQADDNRETG